MQNIRDAISAGTFKAFREKFYRKRISTGEA